MLQLSTPTPKTATHSAAHPVTGQRIVSMPRILLHLEGLAVAASAIAIYTQQGWSWSAFFALLFAPDLALIAFLAGPAVGARVYNAFHFYALPLVLGVIGLLTDVPVAIQIAVIWCTHIGMDRALGYGLKYATGFKDTHIARM